MVSRNERDDVDLIRFEATQASVTDEVLRVTVVVFVADVDAYVVKQTGKLEPLSLLVALPVQDARLVEE